MKTELNVSELSQAQQAVVNAIDGIWVVIAGAGTGKTGCLVQRFRRMIEVGIKTSDMLYLTFTNTAAAEMAERAGVPGSEKVFRTFHSFAMDLLRRERTNLPFNLNETVIPVKGEQFSLLFDLVKMYPMIESWKALQDKLSVWKRAGVSPGRAIEESDDRDYFYAAAYEDYEKKCRQQGWLDFDSLMQEAVQLLKTNSEARERNKIPYIAVDEGQDTDPVQFELLKLIFSGNILIVGDEGQLIYAWRSAQLGNLSNFHQTFPGAQTLYLGKNYRSTKAIVRFLKLIYPVDNGLIDHMDTDNPEGVDPVFVRYDDDIMEAHHILDGIKDPWNTAIIARTNRQLFTLQKICTTKGIKYKILGRRDFWEQNEVKRLLELARASSDRLRPATEVLTELIQEHNLLHLYRHSGSPMESDPVENLTDICKMAKNKGNVAEFLLYLKRLTYARKGLKGLTLGTCHQVKGSEYKYVYVIGAEQGRMPHRDGEITEEARIFFVACSRPAETLQISWKGQPSEFFNNLPYPKTTVTRPDEISALD